MGGCTYWQWHISAGVELSLDDFVRIGQDIPVVADVRPSGKYLMSRADRDRGIQPLMKRMLGCWHVDGSCLTVTGKTLRENLAEVGDYPEGHRLFTVRRTN